MKNTLILAAAAALGFVLAASPASAQPPSPYLGEVEIFAFSFCPAGWVPLDGRLLSINQNQALFALLGTTYGGDGQTNFALPLAKPIFTISRGAPQLLQCIAMSGIFPSQN